MKKSITGTTVIESIMVMVIVIIGVIGMYDIFIKSQNLADSSENRIQAIQIAREGIEAMMNIRDTNWILFGAHTANCWNVRNNQSSCITTPIPIDSGSYIIYKGPNDRWNLTEKNTGNFSDTDYRNRFLVYVDQDGLYNQSGGIAPTSTPLFTREIKVTSIMGRNGLNIKSIVQWVDASKSDAHKVELETTLTNWKKD